VLAYIDDRGCFDLNENTILLDNNNNNNIVHLYLTSAIFQSIYCKLKSLSIETLGERRLSTSQLGLLKQAGL